MSQTPDPVVSTGLVVSTGYNLPFASQMTVFQTTDPVVSTGLVVSTGYNLPFASQTTVFQTTDPVVSTGWSSLRGTICRSPLRRWCPPVETDRFGRLYGLTVSQTTDPVVSTGSNFPFVSQAMVSLNGRVT